MTSRIEYKPAGLHTPALMRIAAGILLSFVVVTAMRELWLWREAPPPGAVPLNALAAAGIYCGPGLVLLWWIFALTVKLRVTENALAAAQAQRVRASKR